MSVVISRLVWVGVVFAGVLFLRRLMPENPVELPDQAKWFGLLLRRGSERSRVRIQ